MYNAKKIVVILLISFILFHECNAWGKYGKTGYTKSGYKTYKHNGKNKLVHRRVYEKKYGKIPKGYEIHHVNHNKLDNRVENLEALPKNVHREYHRINNKKS